VVVRFSANAVPDSTFGTSGVVETSFGAGVRAIPSAVAVLADASIVVGGSTRTTSGVPLFAFARYSAAGVLLGMATAAFTRGSTGEGGTQFATELEAADLVVQADGRIVLAGRVRFPTGPSQFALARFLPDGRIDTSFGASGRAVTPFTLDAAASALALTADGKLVAGGVVGTRFGLARFTASGALDSTFGFLGVVVTDIPETSQEQIADLALQPDGFLVAGGFGVAAFARTVFALARYHGVAPGHQPDCDAAVANPAELWPPDGRFVEVSIGRAGPERRGGADHDHRDHAE
jgi:uncharacterized delta-60 repeat protein